MKSTYELSVIVPLYNEEQNVKLLYNNIKKHLEGLDYEVIFIDDGSSDGTLGQALKLKDDNLRIIKFARNYGQTSAMAAGISHASGEYIATLDGDLQNDPADIPMMLDRLKKEKLDLVAGRRAKRKDGLWFRKIPSMIANYLIRKSTKVRLSDIGCTLKIFRTSLAKKLELYGELHRFIPILASLYGAKIAEVNVKHYPRKYGQTKYGISRTIRVISDLLLMIYFIRYQQRPMHLFGTLGQISLGLGGLIMAYLLLIKIFGAEIGHRPLLFISILLLITGIQFMTTGFLAELIMRTNFAAEKKTPYTIETIYIGGDDSQAKK